MDFFDVTCPKFFLTVSIVQHPLCLHRFWAKVKPMLFYIISFNDYYFFLIQETALGLRISVNHHIQITTVVMESLPVRMACHN